MPGPTRLRHHPQRGGLRAKIAASIAYPVLARTKGVPVLRSRSHAVTLHDPSVALRDISGPRYLAVACSRTYSVAVDVWQRFGAPYEAARVRELLGLTCRALGDEVTAALELEAARMTFADLGAAPDLARLDSLPGGTLADAHGLTERELEVLRHLTSGKSNKVIAAELVLSVRTVDRHVSNIFAKLGVSSRAAAATYAHEHRLI